MRCKGSLELSLLCYLAVRPDPSGIEFRFLSDEVSDLLYSTLKFVYRRRSVFTCQGFGCTKGLKWSETTSFGEK